MPDRNFVLLMTVNYTNQMILDSRAGPTYKSTVRPAVW